VPAEFLLGRAEIQHATDRPESRGAAREERTMSEAHSAGGSGGDARRRAVPARPAVHAFHIQLLVICSLVTFFDGLDFSLISFTLPYLRDEMASATDDRLRQLGAFLGQMIGSLVGSYLADLYGRRR
jgi:hypothetical protein